MVLQYLILSSEVAKCFWLFVLSKRTLYDLNHIWIHLNMRLSPTTNIFGAFQRIALTVLWHFVRNYIYCYNFYGKHIIITPKGRIYLTKLFAFCIAFAFDGDACTHAKHNLYMLRKMISNCLWIIGLLKSHSKQAFIDKIYSKNGVY